MCEQCANSPNFLLRNFGRDRSTPEFNIHCLRHTMAKLLLQDGELGKVVQERLGHSFIVQTHDTYTHVLPTMQQNAASKMEAIMFRRR